MIFTKLLTEITARKNLIKPHAMATDITRLNFQKMKDMGMNKIILSKENTLTRPYSSEFINDQVKAAY